MDALTTVRLCDFIVQALYPLSLYLLISGQTARSLNWIKHTNTFLSHHFTEILTF